MCAKIVVVELWYGFCEETYCIIEHPLWCLERCSLRLWLMGIICNFWEPIRQTYGSIMHTRAMQVKTRQCLNPRRRPSATIRIESACVESLQTGSPVVNHTTAAKMPNDKEDSTKTVDIELRCAQDEVVQRARSRSGNSWSNRPRRRFLGKETFTGKAAKTGILWAQ